MQHCFLTCSEPTAAPRLLDRGHCLHSSKPMAELPVLCDAGSNSKYQAAGAVADLFGNSSTKAGRHYFVNGQPYFEASPL